MPLLYSLIASPLACRFPDLYQELGIEEERFLSARNLHRALKHRVPDFFVGEFVYAWGNDYAGNTVSNLDVTLRTFQAVAPRAKIIIVMQPNEAAHVGKLLELFPVHAVLTYPVSEEQMRAALQSPAVSVTPCQEARASGAALAWRSMPASPDCSNRLAWSISTADDRAAAVAAPRLPNIFGRVSSPDGFEDTHEEAHAFRQ